MFTCKCPFVVGQAVRLSIDGKLEWVKIREVRIISEKKKAILYRFVIKRFGFTQSQVILKNIKKVVV